MKCIDPGHMYKIDSIDGELEQTITFVKRFRQTENHAGTTNQELLRVIIDRVQFLNLELPWEGNKEILKYLRMALVLHEARALIRHVEKEKLNPEDVLIDPTNGHFRLDIA